MANECMLSTIDNPFNPFENFDEWFRYDTEYGHDCCSYLARIAKTSEMLSDEENSLEVEKAIDEIIKYNPENIYIKVRPDTKIDKEKQKVLMNNLKK